MDLVLIDLYMSKTDIIGIVKLNAHYLQLDWEKYLHKLQRRENDWKVTVVNEEYLGVIYYVISRSRTNKSKRANAVVRADNSIIT